MSLAQRVVIRNQIDLLNEGLQYSATGTTGIVTDLVVVPISAERAPIVMGFTLTSNSATPFLVSIGFKKGGDATLTFFQAYVSASMPIQVQYNSFAWYRGDLNYNVVLTTAGQTAYTIDAKVTSFPAALGYIEHEGGQSPSGHLGRAMLPPSSGKDRAQSEL
jgi:hypothetical protein